MCPDAAFPSRPGSRGHTLPELLAALVIMAVIMTGVAAVFTAQSRLLRSAGDRSELLGARHMAAAILRQELRAIVPVLDGTLLGPDSVALRAFRGSAIVCARDSASVQLRYRGVRLPDPSKDSLLVVGAASEQVLAFGTVTAPVLSLCTPLSGEQVLRLTPPQSLTIGNVALLFERGAWYLSSGALRYRRGLGGRQPVTADAFLDDSTDFAWAVRAVPGDTAGIALRLTTQPGQGPAARPLRLRLPLLNSRLPLDSTTSCP